MKNFVLCATLAFCVFYPGSGAFANGEKVTPAQQAQIDNFLLRMFQYDAKYPRVICGVGYRGPSAEESKGIEEMMAFRENAKEQMKGMGPKVIPLLLASVNANGRKVQETIIETLAEMGQPTLSEIEKFLNDGRLNDFRGVGSDFPEIIEILSKSKADNTALISNMLKSKNLNCRLFALKAMSKLHKKIPALNNLVEKSASDIHETVRAAAIEVIALDAQSNKNHLDMVIQAIRNDETSLVRTRAMNAMSVLANELNSQDKAKYDAQLQEVLKTDHIKLARDYASYAFNPNTRRRLIDENAPPVFKLQAKDSIYSSPLPKPALIDKAKKAALDASVSSILEQINTESHLMRANYNPRKNTSFEQRGKASFDYFIFNRFARSKEQELRELGPDALESLIKYSNFGNVDASAACVSAILWFDYDSIPPLARALEASDEKQPPPYLICATGARSNALFEQVLSEGSDNAKLSALKILSYQLPRLNHHKSISHPIEVSPKLVKLVEKCMNSDNTQVSEQAKVVREQIDYSQCVLLVCHHR
ncbi:MAG: hypothetical protein KIT34_00360 [Cyanobacteria bacterium TGS_CYA1]|nr:hypothetical protein [Cyanobacteria bacterium TGS_CYA1]